MVTTPVARRLTRPRARQLAISSLSYFSPYRRRRTSSPRRSSRTICSTSTAPAPAPMPRAAGRSFRAASMRRRSTSRRGLARSPGPSTPARPVRISSTHSSITICTRRSSTSSAPRAAARLPACRGRLTSLASATAIASVTIFDNAMANALDNTNHVPGTTSNFLNDCGGNGGGAPDSSCNNDVSLALGFNFVLDADQQVTLSLVASTVRPAGGFFLRQSDPDSPGDDLYLSGALAVTTTAPAPVPEPASLLLVGAGLAALAGRARRRMRGGLR